MTRDRFWFAVWLWLVGPERIEMDNPEEELCARCSHPRWMHPRGHQFMPERKK